MHGHGLLKIDRSASLHVHRPDGVGVLKYFLNRGDSYLTKLTYWGWININKIHKNTEKNIFFLIFFNACPSPHFPAKLRLSKLAPCPLQ